MWRVIDRDDERQHTVVEFSDGEKAMILNVGYPSLEELAAKVAASFPTDFSRGYAAPADVEWQEAPVLRKRVSKASFALEIVRIK